MIAKSDGREILPQLHAYGKVSSCHTRHEPSFLDEDTIDTSPEMPPLIFGNLVAV